MKVLITLLHLAYWLAVAYIPIGIRELDGEVRGILGCPPLGECYAKGWNVLISVQLTSAYAALILWPLCLSFVWRLLRKALLPPLPDGSNPRSTEIKR
ncbi:MAG: hypothetical protein WEK74_10500 [Hydrogenophaga sp.]